MADNPFAAWLREQGRETQPDPFAAVSGTNGTAASGEPARDEPIVAAGQHQAPSAGSSGAADPWDGVEEPSRPAGRRLWLIAGVPWIVVVLLGVAVFAGEQPQAGGAAAAPVAGAPTPPAIPTTTQAVATARSAADEDLATLAPLLVRAALSHPGQDAQALAEPGTAEPSARYVDDAVTTGVERIGDAAVVTVAALVLHGDRDGWNRAQYATYALAFRDGPDGPTVAAGPWTVRGLAAPEPAGGDSPTGPLPEAAPEAVDAAREALEHADWEIRELEAGRDPALPDVLLVRTTAVAPGEQVARRHDLWLRDGPRPVLLGAP